MRPAALMLFVLSACSSTPPCAPDAGVSCDGGGTMGTTGAVALAWTLEKNDMVRACSEVPGADQVRVTMTREGQMPVTDTFECSEVMGSMTNFDFGQWELNARLLSLDGGAVSPAVTRTLTLDGTSCSTTIAGSCVVSVTLRFDVD